MLDFGPHAVFIAAAYIGVGLAIAALVGWTLWDGRRTARQLAALEALRRRPAGPAA